MVANTVSPSRPYAETVQTVKEQNCANQNNKVIPHRDSTTDGVHHDRFHSKCIYEWSTSSEVHVEMPPIPNGQSNMGAIAKKYHRYFVFT